MGSYCCRYINICVLSIKKHIYTIKYDIQGIVWVANARGEAEVFLAKSLFTALFRHFEAKYTRIYIINHNIRDKDVK